MLKNIYIIRPLRLLRKELETKNCGQITSNEIQIYIHDFIDIDLRM